MSPVQKILIVEDDRLQFRITERQLANARMARFAVDWAETFEDGLRLLLTGDYAACLLDYQLGTRDGLELLREARAQHCETPVVFLTADSSEEVDHAAMEAGASDYLVKGEITPRIIERALRYSQKLAGAMRELRLLATRDELTGLLNRREFDRVLAEETERAWRLSHPLALVMFDLDHFKAVNDTHGHPAGDSVLRAVAERLLGGLRTIDRLARVGGEEFGLVLLESGSDEALVLAQRLVELVRGEPVVLPDGTRLPVTVSAGVAVLPTTAHDTASLIAAADKALYTAKHAGRDRAVLAE